MSICCLKKMAEINDKWRICFGCGIVLHIKARHNGKSKLIYHLPGTKIAKEKAMEISIQT